MNAVVELFKRYQGVVEWREWLRYLRAKSGGIAVDTDELALEWQKYDKLAEELAQEIIARLKGENEDAKD